MAESLSRAASVADFTFKVGDLTTEDLKVTGFSGTEGISELYQFRVDFCSDQSDISFASVVGKPCVLEIAGPSGSRFVHGIVRRFERTGEGVNLTHYAAEVVPVHWLLTKRYRSRIYQNLSVPDIIKKVFDDAGIPSDRYRFATTGTYAALEYVVQYRESEFDFVSRLMEREGIFYFFEHAVDGHKLVLGDAPVAHTDTPNQAEFPFRAPTGLLPDEDREHVFALRDAEEMQTGLVSLDDFDFQKPATDLRGESTDSTPALFHSDYPGGFVDRSVGQTYATVRLAEFQCAKREQYMAATARGLLPGFKFTLIEHPNDALNTEYLVTHLSHRATEQQAAAEESALGTGPHYQADVRTIPSTVTLRPSRKTPRPRVEGSQTALVVGPSGEEIYTDNYGRVKVQFHWDEEGQYNEQSSCWIRVSQGSAGGQYGMMFLPRVGQEVVVDFLEGDPDKPIITGRVYNNDQMPPYTLPDEKTKSTIKTNSSTGGGGTNEIRFEDKKDSEQLLLQAQKQMDTNVKANHFHSVGGNYHLRVGWKDEGSLYELVHKDKHVHVKNNSNTLIDTDESVTVKGKVSIKVTGTHSTDVGGDVVFKFGGNHKHDVTQTYALKAMSIKLEASSGIELKCGGASVVLTPSAVSINGSMVNINSGSGPSVSPVSASATSPTAAEDAAAAEETQPGHDVTYNPAAAEFAALELEPGEFTPVEVPEPEAPEELTWIEIELVDEADQPCAGEAYEMELEDGKVRRGTLDANGLARQENLKPGTVKVRFPRLDAAAWERIS
jgi:type VI secretion system secreted protein VgrG